MSRGSSSSGREVGQKSSRDSEEESAVLARDVVDPNCGKLAVLARDVIDLNCPVCLDLMDGEVVQCETSQHPLCQKCWEKLRSVNYKKSCPECRDSYNQDAGKRRASYFMRLVQNVDGVPCLYKAKGCKSELLVGAWRAHVDTCNWGFEDCDLGCGVKVRVDTVGSERDHHRDYFCKNAPMICEICLATVRRCDMVSHILSTDEPPHPHRVAYMEDQNPEAGSMRAVARPSIKLLPCAKEDQSICPDFFFQYSDSQAVLICESRGSEPTGAMFVVAKRSVLHPDDVWTGSLLYVEARLSSGIKFFEGKQNLKIKFKVLVKLAVEKLHTYDFESPVAKGFPFIMTDLTVEASLKGLGRAQATMGLDQLYDLWCKNNPRDRYNTQPGVIVSLSRECSIVDS